MHARQRPNSLTYIEIDRENGGIVLDACKGGVSVQAVVSITENELPQIRMKLPDSNDWLETRARVIWTRESRKIAGLQFEELSDQSLAQLNDWLSRDASTNTSEVVHAGAPTIRTKAIETELVETHAIKIEATEASAVQTDSVDSNAGTTLTEAEFGRAPAVVDYTDQSASDFGEPGPPRALENSVPAENIRTAPFTLGQKTNTRVEKTETHLEHVPETKNAPVLALVEDKSRISSVYLLLFVLALVSLTAGWAAGRGKFGSAFQKFRTLLHPMAPAAPPFEMRAGTLAAPVKEIEIVDASNQHWAIPLRAPIAKINPLRAQPSPISAPAFPPKSALNFQIWTLTAPKRSASPSVVELAPPPVNERQGMPEIAPPGAGQVGPTGYTLAIPGNSAGVLKRGTLLHRVDPEYPALAKDQRISGTVVLEANVGPDGAVRSVKVISGPQLLVPAAINAVRQWRYAPTLLDGKPIETQVRINLVFHLPASGQ